MIDFNNDKYLKLTQVKTGSNAAALAPLLIAGEEVISEYKTIRDFVAFTNRRIIVVNVQGVTGKKKDYTSLPYSKIQAFSVETSGVFDLDAELELYFSGLGKVKLEFTGGCDIAEIARMIGERIL